MAVIREKQQFRNTRIGVVRTDTGEEQVWNTVGQAADTLTENAFRVAAANAKKKGQELGQSISDASLRTIDPSTGKPQAYTAPDASGFGTVAQAAYEETIDRRYIRSIDQEIQNKAKETYLKYESDPQGVEKYSEVMEDYVGKMTKNADSRFQSIIKDTGASFIASTKFNLLQKRNLRIKEAEQVAQKQDASDVASMIEAMSSNVDFNYMDSQGVLDIQELFKEGIAGQRSALDGGFISNAQYNENITIMRRALPKAILSKMINFDSVYEAEDGTEKRMTSDVALAIENSLSSGRVVDDVPLALRPQIEKIINGESYNEDRTKLTQKVRELRVQLGTKEGSVKKATKLEIATKKIINGQRVFNTDAVSREAAQNIIRDDSGLPKDVSMNEYFGLPQSVGNSTLNAMIYRGIIPDALMQNIMIVASGDQPANDDFIESTINHYLNYSSMIDSSGQRRNLLLIDGGITKEQDAMMRSAIAMRNFRGGNLRDILSNQRAVLENKDAFNIRASDVFKEYAGDSANEKIDRFISKELGIGNDIYAIRNMRPLINHMVATNHNLESIKTQTTNLLNELYMEDDEDLIADPFNFDPNKSFYALKRVFPDDKDRLTFVAEVQKELLDRGFEGFIFSSAMKQRGATDRIKNVRLVPLPQQPLSTESTVIYMGVYRDDNGDMVPLQDASGPFMISSDIISEQQEARIEAQRQALVAEQDRIIAEKERQKARQQKSIKALKGLSGRN